MSADTRVAKRYAKALYGVALKGNAVESVESDLNGIADLMKKEAAFKDFMLSPNVPRDRRMRILETIFAPRVHATTMAALRLLVAKRRENVIPDVRDGFVEIRREIGNVLYAQVTSARELSSDDQRRIADKLASTSGKRVEAEYRVDASLIGGVRVAYGNHVLDGSIRGGLRRLKDQLRYELLKQA